MTIWGGRELICYTNTPGLYRIASESCWLGGVKHFYLFQMSCCVFFEKWNNIKLICLQLRGTWHFRWSCYLQIISNSFLQFFFQCKCTTNLDYFSCKYIQFYQNQNRKKKKSKSKLQKKLGLGKLQIFSNEQDVVTYTGKYEAKRILT